MIAHNGTLADEQHIPQHKKSELTSLNLTLKPLLNNIDDFKHLVP